MMRAALTDFHSRSSEMNLKKLNIFVYTIFIFLCKTLKNVYFRQKLKKILLAYYFNFDTLKMVTFMIVSTTSKSPVLP